MPVRRRCLLLAFALPLLACEGSPTESIDIDGPTLDALGDEVQLPTRFSGSDRPVEWRSLNPTIVRVTSAGLAKAVGHGEALLEGRAGGRTAETILTVREPTRILVDSVTVEPLLSGTELVSMRVHNSGGRGTYRITVFGRTPAGDPLQYLQTDWTLAPPALLDEIVFEVDTQSNGLDSRVHSIMVETLPATYPESTRYCVGPNGHSVTCLIL